MSMTTQEVRRVEGQLEAILRDTGDMRERMARMEERQANNAENLHKVDSEIDEVRARVDSHAKSSTANKIELAKEIAGVKKEVFWLRWIVGGVTVAVLSAIATTVAVDHRSTAVKAAVEHVEKAAE